MKKPARKVSVRLEQLRSQRHVAMPQVKAMVKKFGRQTIAYCLSQLREHEKSLSKLQHLKEEVSRLEKQL